MFFILKYFFLKNKFRKEADNGKYAVALYTYNKTRDDELDLHKGQIIMILEESEDDWWRGRNMESGADGWFPSNYVEYVSHYYQNHVID